MNALAEYSDSEDEAPKEKKTGSKPPTESNVASGAKAASKIASISFLPSNIQAALRGDVSYDSDSEVETVGGEPSRAEGTYVGHRSRLLSILPTPKNKISADTLSTAANVATCKSSSISSSSSKWVPPTTSTASTSRVPSNSSNSNTEAVIITTEPESEDNLLFTVPQRKKAVSRPVTIGSTDEGHTIDEDVQAHHRAAYAALHQDRRQIAATSSSSRRGGGGSGGDGASKRKRERALEQELLHGNVAALDCADVNTGSMCLDGQAWKDKTDYYARKEEEEKVRQDFHVSSGGGAGGSKLQRSRHQLSSMAAQAVQSRIAQLERQRAQKENSADRRAKYGF
jgi:hypothetical protein